MKGGVSGETPAASACDDEGSQADRAGLAPTDRERKDDMRHGTHVGAPAIALACALAATLLSAGPASARSVGFNIYNLSSRPLVLDRVSGGGPAFGPIGFEEGPTAPVPPREGDVLMPGAASQHIELDFNGLKTHGAHLTYGQGRSPQLDVFMGTWAGATCHVQPRPYVCTVDGSRIRVFDPLGTVYEVPKDRAQEQAEVMKGLCNETNAAKCTFTPHTRTKTLTQRHIVGKPLSNCNETEVETRITEEDKVVNTNSLSIEVGFEFGTEAASASVKAKYGHEWTTEHTFSQDVTLRIRPGWVGWVAATQPVLRDTGDFTLELGNTTWNVRDVSFETPDPNRPGDGEFVTDGKQLSEDEYASTCKHKRPGLTQVPTHFVRMHWKGTRDHDVLLAGPESHTVRGFAGNDLLRGGRGHDILYGGRDDDTLHGGRHRDTLNGGPDNDILDGGLGRDTLDGGPGADTITDHRGPTLVQIGVAIGPGRDTVDVRDGRDDDTVMCGSRRSTVVVDVGDRVIGRCGRVSRSGSIR
jgi:RTX calcium-binding nonapeptide repeat (4 copies)